MSYYLSLLQHMHLSGNELNKKKGSEVSHLNYMQNGLGP